MDRTEKYLSSLFESYKLPVSEKRKKLFEEFVIDSENVEMVNTIVTNQKKMVDSWKIKNLIADVNEKQLLIPNATVDKKYEAEFSLKKYNLTEILDFEIEGLENAGELSFDKALGKITGTPKNSGEFKLIFKFKLKAQSEDSPFNERQISFIVNPNPKSLWKDLPSDTTDTYWKEDNETIYSKLGDRQLVVSSKRGRSHANVGSFRDDDFAYTHIESNGWSVVAVSDGAGSAKISRYGSKLACQTIVDYFIDKLNDEFSASFSKLIEDNHNTPSDEIKKELSLSIYNLIGGAANQTHKTLNEYATTNNFTLNDLNSTLIYTIFKTFSFGTVVLSFGVGDCPIAHLSKDLSEVKLLNWLDVGEFGGGTRFITTTEIFASQKFASRINFKIIENFGYLFLMTDGIYDAKFVVEANLEKLETWKEFVADLNGNNESSIKVNLEENNPNLCNELSEWMDFWSPGNHDDRTLAIVF